MGCSCLQDISTCSSVGWGMHSYSAMVPFTWHASLWSLHGLQGNLSPQVSGVPAFLSSSSLPPMSMGVNQTFFFLPQLLSIFALNYIFHRGCLSWLWLLVVHLLNQKHLCPALGNPWPLLTEVIPPVPQNINMYTWYWEELFFICCSQLTLILTIHFFLFVVVSKLPPPVLTSLQSWVKFKLILQHSLCYRLFFSLFLSC